MALKKIIAINLFALAAWGTSAHATTTIGALFPMSGPNAVYSDIFGSGANLAVEHLNADKLLSEPLAGGRVVHVVAD